MAIQHAVVFAEAFLVQLQMLTDVTDPNIINHTCQYNALPMRLDTKALKLISSFRCNVASVEEPSFQQSLWDFYLPFCLEVGWCCAITMLSQKHVDCCYLVNFGHELILCHSWSESEKKTRSVHEVCIQICITFPWQGTCHEILFPRWQREREGKKRGPGCKAERDALHPTILFQAGGLVITIFCPSASLPAVLSVLRVRFD